MTCPGCKLPTEQPLFDEELEIETVEIEDEL